MAQTSLITAPFRELWRGADSVVVIDGIGLDGKVFIDDPLISVQLVKSPEILSGVDDAEFAQFQKVSETVFQRLITELNRVHQTHLSERYWRIVCGAWFLQFAQVWYLRWKVAGVVFREFGEVTCPQIKIKWQELLPVTHDEASLLFATDIWNHIAYVEAYKSVMNSKQVGLQVDSPDQSRELAEYRKIINYGLPSQNPKSKLEIVLAKLSPNPKIVLAGVVQTRLALVAMHLRLGMLPRLWRFAAKLTPQPINEKLRGDFLKIDDGQGGFAQFLSQSISRHLPTVYLEGYKNLIEVSLNENLLRKPPKAIFTNTLLARSEQFKVWCATYIDQGNTKLLSGQHGGGYLVTKFPGWSEAYELSVVNHFLSWGKVTSPVIGLATCVQASVGSVEPNYSGKLLIVLGPVTRQQNNFNLGNVHCNSSYFEMLGTFVNSFDDTRKKHILVRPKNASVLTKPARISSRQISDLFEDLIKIDDGVFTLSQRLTECRLAVVTYNETTIPTNLKAGFPTIALWDSKYVRLNDQATDVYEKLREAKILFYSSSEAARHISEIWSDVECWWNSQMVREARDNYCEHYAHQTRLPALTVGSMIADSL